MKPVLSRKFSFAPGFCHKSSPDQQQRQMDPVSKSKSLDVYSNRQVMDFDEELTMILKGVEEKRANNEIKRPVPVRPDTVADILSKSNSLDSQGRLIRKPAPLRSNSTIVHLESEEDSAPSSPFQKFQPKDQAGLFQPRKPLARKSNSSIVHLEAEEEIAELSKSKPVLMRAEARILHQLRHFEGAGNIVTDGPTPVKPKQPNESLSKRLSLDPKVSEARPEFKEEIRQIVERQVENEKRDVLTPIPRLTRSMDNNRRSSNSAIALISGDKTLKVKYFVCAICFMCALIPQKS